MEKEKLIKELRELGDKYLSRAFINDKAKKIFKKEIKDLDISKLKAMLNLTKYYIKRHKKVDVK